MQGSSWPHSSLLSLHKDTCILNHNKKGSQRSVVVAPDLTAVVEVEDEEEDADNSDGESEHQIREHIHNDKSIIN